MALTFADVRRWSQPYNGIRYAIEDITLDNAYPAGGWPITAANLKFNTVIYGGVVIGGGAPLGALLLWDTTNGKLMAFNAAAAGALFTELGTATFLNAKVVRMEFRGF